MEERYAGDTVELIDYLRVLWWGKWLILGCLVIAIALSALFVSLRPTTYSGSAKILLREYVTAALAGDLGATAAMTSAVEFTLAAIDTAVPDIAASLAADRITLLQSNAAAADAVREALVQAEAVLGQQLPLALAEEFKHLAYETRLQKNSLAAQMKILRQQLIEDQANSEIPVSEALAERIAELEAQLAQKQVLLDTLETAEPGALFLLSPIGVPKITASGSNLKTTIAIAGFLGLMIGVLLAFFVHYLLQIRVRERAETKVRST